MSGDNLDNMDDDALADAADAVGLSTRMKRPKLVAAIRRRRAAVDATSREDLARLLSWGGVDAQDFQSRDVLVRAFYGLDFRSTEGLAGDDLRLAAALLGIDWADVEDDATLAERVEDSAARWTDIFKGARRFFSRKSDDDEEEGDEVRPRKGVVTRMLHRKVSDTLRHTVDPYISEKLDEIESRIDRKLDDLDRKMDDWRTREVRHRLRILKWTVIATVIVAILSLLYKWLRPG